MPSEIKPCPFCGSDSPRVLKNNEFWVECDKCWACGPECGGKEEDGDRSDAAIEWWNKAKR